MSSQTTNKPTWRVPKESDDSMAVYKGITIQDLILFAPGIFLAILSLAVVPRFVELLPIGLQPHAFTLQLLIVSGATVLVASVAFLTAPDYYTSFEWALLHAKHIAKPGEYHLTPENYDHMTREQVQEPEHSFLASAIASNQRTQDLLEIDRVYSAREGDPGAVLLTNGTMVGAVRITGANLSLATEREWADATSAIGNLINSIDYPVKFTYTTAQFDIEAFLSNYESRMTDDDVAENPALEELLAAFLDWYPQELENRSSKKSEYYLSVGVEEDEVIRESRTEGVSDQLGELPGLGRFFETDEDRDIPTEVVRGWQRDELFKRVNDLSRRFERVSDMSAEVVPSDAHARVIARTWSRSEQDDGRDIPSNRIVRREQPTSGKTET